MRLPSRNQRFERTTVSLQSMGQRLSFFILLIATIALLIAGRSSSSRMEAVGAFISDLAAPLLGIASKPAQLVSEGMHAVDNYLGAVSENQKLRAEVERLSALQATAQRLSAENAELRDLLKLNDFPPVSSIAARVVGDLGSPFVQTILVNAGTKQGLRKDMPVVDGAGLVGRVVSAGDRVSRVLLLSDINSRVPVRIGSSGYQAVLTGDNQNLPQLSYLSALATAKTGDIIVTSGHGGVFPPGVPVGVVSSIETRPGTQPVIRIQPYSDENRLAFVRILQFELPKDVGGAQAPSPATVKSQTVQPE